jgi:hypothetical protein
MNKLSFRSVITTQNVIEASENGTEKADKRKASSVFTPGTRRNMTDYL